MRFLGLSSLRWLPCLLALGLSACGENEAANDRMERRQLIIQNYKDNKPIELAVVWSKQNSAFLAGAVLAAEEVNAEGGIAGRRLDLQFTDEAPFVNNRDTARANAAGRYRNSLAEAGSDIAKQVLANPNVTAVIGHQNAEATMSSMLAYQNAGILMLAGNATDSRIMWSSSSLYFQLRPKDEVLVAKIASELVKRNWRNGYLVYESTRHNEHVVELLTTEFAKAGVRLVGTVAVMSNGQKSGGGSRRLQNELAELGTGSADAIVLMASPQVGAQVIKQGRALGVLQPFIGAAGLETTLFARDVGEAGADMLVASLYRSDSYQIKRFAERLLKRFPDGVLNESASMGYDSVRLYAEAVASAGTTDPYVVAHALQYKLPLWYGLMGSYVFKDGNNTSLKYYMRRLNMEKNGRLRFVSADDAE